MSAPIFLVDITYVASAAISDGATPYKCTKTAVFRAKYGLFCCAVVELLRSCRHHSVSLSEEEEALRDLAEWSSLLKVGAKNGVALSGQYNKPVHACSASVIRVELAGDTQSPAVVYYDLVLTRCEPLVMAEDFTRSFFRQVSENEPNRRRCQATLRLWRAMCVMVGADLSFGMIDTCRRRLDFSPIDLERRTDLLLDRPLSASHTGHSGGGGRGEGGPFDASIRDRLRGCPTFRALDDGTTWLFVLFEVGEMALLVANEEGQKGLMGVERLRELTAQYRLLPFLMFASLVAPVDRASLFDVIASFTYLCPGRAKSAILKVVNKDDGTVDLCVLKARVVAFPEFNNVNNVVFTLEKVPTFASSRFYNPPVVLSMGREPLRPPASVNAGYYGATSPQWEGAVPAVQYRERHIGSSNRAAYGAPAGSGGAVVSSTGVGMGRGQTHNQHRHRGDERREEAGTRRPAPRDGESDSDATVDYGPSPAASATLQQDVYQQYDSEGNEILEVDQVD